MNPSRSSASSGGYPRQSNIPSFEALPVPLARQSGAALATAGPSHAQVVKIVEGELANVRLQSWAALEAKDYKLAVKLRAEEQGLKDRIEELTAEAKKSRELEKVFKEAQEQALAVYVPKPERLAKLNQKLIEARFSEKPSSNSEICSLRLEIQRLEEEIRQEKLEEDLKKRGLENGSQSLTEQMEREKEVIPEMPNETEQRIRDRQALAGMQLAEWHPEQRTALGTKPRALGMLNKKAALAKAAAQAEEKRVVSAKVQAAKAKAARRRARNAQEAAAAREAHYAYMQRKREAESKKFALQEEWKLLSHGLLDYEDEDVDECAEKKDLLDRLKEVEAKIEECEEAMRPPKPKPRPKAKQLPSDVPTTSTDVGAHDEALSEASDDD